MARRLGLVLLWIALALSRASAVGYERIDAAALATPPSAERSVKALAAYLNGLCQTDHEKARAAFRWVTDRVRYDLAALRKGTQLDGSPEATLKRRIAVCDGYARLYEALVAEMGLPVKRINGYLKGFGGLGTAYHAWDAVDLNGHWCLVDPTLGAGYADGDSGNYRKRFDEHFFCTPPQEFVWDHFPDEPSLQFLSSPWTRRQFDDHVAVSSGFFRNGVRLGNDNSQRASLDCGPTVTLTLYAPPRQPDGGPPSRGAAGGVTRETLSMSARLQGDRQGPPSRGDCVLTTRSGQEYRFEVRLPAAGHYTVRIFAGAAGSGTLTSMVEYQLQCARGMAHFVAFPLSYGVFVPLQVHLDTPRSGELRAGTLETFRLTTPSVEEMLIDNAGQRLELTRRGQLFEGKLRLRKGRLTIYEGKSGQALKHAVLAYEVV